MIYEFNGMRPTVHPTAFIHPLATVLGNVQIGAHVYIGSGAAIRADWGRIIIEDGCNVQENCTVHMFPGTTVRLMEGAHVGHGAIIHGATLGRNCLIGMNAVVMDDAQIGDGCLVGALCLVPSEMKIPDRKIVVGNPARVVKDVTEAMAAWKMAGTDLYRTLPEELRQAMRELPLEMVLSTAPIPDTDPYSGRQEALLSTWKKTEG